MSLDDELRKDDELRAGRLSYDRADAVIAGWVEFLERLQADTFFTVTFDDRKCGFAVSGQNAVNRSEWVVKAVAKSVKRSLPSFVVAEPHRSGVYHTHGLMRIGGLDEDMDWETRRALWRAAFSKYGRNEFREIADVGGVRGYVSKYLVKRRADWSILFPKEWLGKGCLVNGDLVKGAYVCKEDGRGATG